MIRPVAMFLALICLVAGHAVAAPSLEGRWRLVEQTYGKGQSNLVDEAARPVNLEFTRQGTELEGKIWSGEDSTRLSWPSLAPGQRPETIEEKRFSSAQDQVLVRYRIAPPPGDDLVLRVTEEYRVIDDGDMLEGRVDIEFHRGGKTRGSYTLHRRFERLP